MAKVLGVDEAGRGPVLGSMFIGGFVVEESKLGKLGKIGVKDSKKLSERKRERLRKELDDIGDVILKEIEGPEIDELRSIMTLNEIEIQGFVDVIERSDADKIIVDLPEPNAKRFVRKLKDELPRRFENREFIAEHKADDKYDVVSAASIAAKSARENHVDELKSKYGYDFGSGYPHDEPTIKFLEKYVEEYDELPPETRKSWSTAERIMKEAGQKGLGDF